jgi:hypothetical protein
MMVAEAGACRSSRAPAVGDTTAIGSALTGGSRVTFAGGMAVTQRPKKSSRS